MLELSAAEARHLLVRYHFRPTDVAGLMERLGTIQYDPLNVVGRNPDLVFQARVPGYRVDDWQDLAYRRRIMYDAWDKQACLVPLDDWSHRAYARVCYQPWHDREILAENPVAVTAALAEIDRRGPLSSLEFADRERIEGRHSWYGPTRIKRVVRALWSRGTLMTHHRAGTRHYYERPERILPPRLLAQPALDSTSYHRWIMARRFQATGILRSAAEPAVWSACGDASTRASALEALTAEGTLVPLGIGGQRSAHFMHSALLPLLEENPTPDRVIFLGPLDSMLWDRAMIRQLFGFDYVWEVYKPEAVRRWGYYVLPVLWGNRFVARIDSALRDGVWVIARWWWEDDVVPDADLLAGVTETARDFVSFLDARGVVLADGMDHRVARALRSLR